MSSLWRGEARAFLVLGLPIAATQLVQFFIQTIDVLMIGRLGPEPLAGAALGSAAFFAIAIVGMGPAMAVSPVVAQALGARSDDYDTLRRCVRMALWLCLMSFPVVLALCLAVEPATRWLGQPEAVVAGAGPYVLALAPGLPFMLAVMVLRNALAALGLTRWPLLLIVATTFVNTALNAVLIFGALGVPALGLVGAGIASSLSHAIGFALLALYAARAPALRPASLFADWAVFDRERLRELVVLGLPISVALAFEMLLFNAAVPVMGRISVEAVAAYQVALNVAALGYMVAFGFSLAGGTRVGLAAGAGDAAAMRRAALVSLLGCVLAIGCVAGPVALFPGAIAGLYLPASESAQDAVRALVVSFLPLAAAFALFDALQVSAHQALRGLKDVRVPMLLAGASFWGVGFPLAAWLALRTALGPQGVWYGLTAGLACAALLLVARLGWWLRRPVRSPGSAGSG